MSLSTEQAYSALLAETREAALLESCSAVLGWDEQTYMPPGGAEHRSNQLALLAGLAHEKATSPRVGNCCNSSKGPATSRPTR